MASGTISTRPQSENAPIQGRYEDFIQKRLEHTRRQVRLVDVASSLMLLAAASLLFFLAVAVLDHWVFHHGLGFIARLGLFAAVGRRGRGLRVAILAAVAGQSHQSGLCRADDRAGPPDAQEQPDQFPLAARASAGCGTGGVSRDGTPRGGRSAEGAGRPCRRSRPRGTPGLRAGGRGRRLCTVSGPLAEEPLALGGARALAVVEHPGAYAGPH